MTIKTTASEVARLLNRRDATVPESDATCVTENRLLAHCLIYYGIDRELPLAIAAGIELLDQNPGISANGKDGADAKDRERYLKAAANLAKNDPLVMQLVKRLEVNTSEQACASTDTRSKTWKVEIAPKKRIRLKPDPIFEPQTKAVLTATASDQNAMIGMTVRAVDQKLTRRTSGRGRVRLAWNPGLKKRKWDVRVYNLTAQRPLKLRVESS